MIQIKKNLDTIILERMKEEILASRWRQGQALSPDEIATHYGVSRTPVIQAMKMMAREGLLTTRSNGRFALPTYTKAEVEDICRVRLLLEDAAIKMLCESKNPFHLRSLRELAETCAEAIRDNNDVVACRSLDLRLHRRIVALSGSDCLITTYGAVQGRYMTANHILLDHSDALQAMASGEHKEILDQLETYNYPAASQALAHHIMSGCHRVLSRLE